VVLVYLSAPIIHSSLRKDDFCSLVIRVLEEKGITVFAPQLLGPADSDVIFNRDVDHVRKSDFLIAEVSNPSLGVGMEIMLSIELLKPALLFYSLDSDRLSKMVEGATGKALFTYDSLEDVDRIIRSLNLDNLLVSKCDSCNNQVAHILDDEIHCVVCGTIISGVGR